MSNSTQVNKNRAEVVSGVVFNPLTSGTSPTDLIPSGFNGLVADSNGVLQVVGSDGSTSPLAGEEALALVADATLAAGSWVYISAAGHCNKARANSASTTPAVGVVPVAIASSATGVVQTAGVYTTTGLTAGATYYVSAATAGAITSTKPTATGQFVQKVGTALSTTQLLLSPNAVVVPLDALAATLDTAAAGALSIGPTTATSIVLGQSTSMTGAATLATGTGAVSINGSATMAAAKSFSPSATGGIGQSVSGFTTFWTGNTGIALATAGNDTACDNGSIWWCSIFVPFNMTITGIGYLIGSVGGTNLAIVGLYSSAGALLASSALAGTTVGTAANFQPLDFTAPYPAVGPALYYAAVQFNGATAKFRTHTAPGLKFVASNVGGTFGTMASITPGSSYTANKGPMAFTY